MNNLRQVKFMLREETRVREAAEQQLYERFQRLEHSCSVAHSSDPPLHDAQMIKKLHERMDNFADVLRASSERLTREMADARYATRELDQRVGSALALTETKITACERTVAALGREAQGIQSMLAERPRQPVTIARARELETPHDGLARGLESPPTGPHLAICGTSPATTSIWWDPGTDADRSRGSQVGSLAMQDAVHSKLQACERQCSKLEEHCTHLVHRVDALDKRGPGTDLSMQVAELTEVVGTEAQVRARHDQSVQECFKELERRFRLHDEKTKSTEKQLQEFMSFKEALAQNAEELKNLKDCFDGALYEVTKSTSLELKNTRDEIDQVFGVLTAVQQSWAARPVLLPSEELMQSR